ncbi:MAG: hypothetical protein SOW59_06730, partial [Corynebacterium sp.]|nr:hypothetical protein [Corynebacterium sp.]
MTEFLTNFSKDKAIFSAGQTESGGHKASTDHDDLLAQAFADHDVTSTNGKPLTTLGTSNSEVSLADSADSAGDGNETAPTLGDLELAERNAFRRVTRQTSIRAEDTTDGYEVEYRKLRLEQVIL